MMNVRRRLVFGLLAVAGCDVQSVAMPPTGVPPSRGVLVVDSDAQSTNIAFLAWDGLSSPSLLSSGARPAGLSVALSGDVVVPTEAPRFSGEAVLIDRRQSVLTWIDPQTAKVRAQLPVSDIPDPYDYIEIAADKAYVLRYGLSQPGDLLVVDPRSPRAVGTISLAEYAPGAPSADPVRFVRGAKPNEVYVLLHGFSQGYCGALDATIVRIDTTSDRVVSSTTLPGLKTCTAAARIDASRFVVSCSGLGLVAISGCILHGGAGLVVIRDDGDTLVEERRFDADALIGAPLSETIDVAFGTRVVFGAFGDTDTGAPDRWLSLDVDVGESSLVELARGGASMLGDLLCEPTRAACFGADADRKTIRRFDIQDGELVEGAPTGFADPYGLPPVTFGRLF